MIRLSKKDIPTRYHLPIKVYAPLSMYRNCISCLIHPVSVYKATPGSPSSLVRLYGRTKYHTKYK